MKREGVLSWDAYFMGIAILSGKRSKDPSTQVGACIVNEEHRIVSIGYNGLPAGCSDDDFPWDKEGAYLDTKYPYVCHAELNAILNADMRRVRGCTVYTTLFPCNECVKALLQAGLRKIVYLTDIHHDQDAFVAARRLLDAAGVAYVPYEPVGQEVLISV